MNLHLDKAGLIGSIVTLACCLGKRAACKTPQTPGALT